MCGGTVYGDEHMQITKLFTDSRQAETESLFVPIIGEKVDAHKFIDQVFWAGSATLSQNKLDKGNYILVKDTLKALQDIGRNYRLKFNIPIVGITGSVGKTTSKEIISLAIESEKKTMKTLGNANSQVGVPLTLLRLEESDEIAVVELGMSMPDEMAKIAYTAMPNMAVISNIGISHIENLGSREKIMEEKLHITDHFDKDSILFINGDDDLLKNIKADYKIISFGLSKNCDYKAVEIMQNENGCEFFCIRNNEKIKMFVPAVGVHNVRNALAALAVAESLGVSTLNAVNEVKEYKSANMRQEIKHFNGITVIDDSYNSSPDSVIASLNVLKSLKSKRKIAVLGDMLELGDYSQKAHREIGEYAKGIDFLICFGNESIETYKAFNDKEKSSHFTDYEQAEKFFLSLIKEEDLILVKGSRGMKTDRFVKSVECLDGQVAHLNKARL